MFDGSSAPPQTSWQTWSTTYEAAKVEQVCRSYGEPGRGVLLMPYTGMRVGEVSARRWEDVDFKRANIHVQRSRYMGEERGPKPPTR